MEIRSIERMQRRISVSIWGGGIASGEESKFMEPNFVKRLFIVLYSTFEGVYFQKDMIYFYHTTQPRSKRVQSSVMPQLVHLPRASRPDWVLLRKRKSSTRRLSIPCPPDDLFDIQMADVSEHWGPNIISPVYARSSSPIVTFSEMN